MSSSPRPEIVDLDPAVTAVVRGVVPMAEMAGFFDQAFGRLAAALTEQGITPTGPAFALFPTPPGEQVQVEVGFPTPQPPRADGDVEPGSLPGGRAARLVHHGAYDDLGDSWQRLGTWLGEQGLAPGQPLWEVYVTQPSPDMDPATLRTELYWLLAPAG